MEDAATGGGESVGGFPVEEFWEIAGGERRWKGHWNSPYFLYAFKILYILRK